MFKTCYYCGALISDTTAGPVKHVCMATLSAQAQEQTARDLERDALVTIPQEMTVGRLNQVVLELRERLHHMTIRAQEAEKKLRRQRHGS